MLKAFEFRSLERQEAQAGFTRGERMEIDDIIRARGRLARLCGQFRLSRLGTNWHGLLNATHSMPKVHPALSGSRRMRRKAKRESFCEIASSASVTAAFGWL